MKVISIGYGRNIFQATNLDRRRLESCAVAVERLDLIIFTSKSDGLTKIIGNNGLALHPTNSSSKFTMLFDAMMIGSQLIKKDKTAYIITTQDAFETGLVGLLLKWWFNVPLTVQEHADVFSTTHWRSESKMNFFRYYIGLSILQRADVIRVVARRIKTTLIEKGLPSHKITQLPVAVAIEDFRTAEPNVKVRSVFDENDFVFLTVARFVKQKNFPLLLKAFAQVVQQNPKAKLLIVGDGPERSILMNLMQHYGFDTTKSVQILPWSDDVPGLMKAADAYVLSSNYEGWGRVLIEALGAGLPIVTTDVGCANEVVLDGVHGLVVPVADSQALATAMKTLVTDEAFYTNCKATIATLDTSALPGADLSHYGTQWAATLTRN